MTANHASARRSCAQMPPLRRLDPHPRQELRRGHPGALVLSWPQPERPAPPPAWSSLTVKAVTALSGLAGQALPALLLGFVSWAVAEFLFGLASYVEAMYSAPAPDAAVPAATKAIDTPHAATQMRDHDDRSLRDIAVRRRNIEDMVRYGVRWE